MSDSPSDLPILDADIISELQDIMEADFADLVETALGSIPAQLADLAAAIEQGHADALYRTAHQLKSGSGNIGAAQLAELARRLEMQGRSGALQDAGALLAQLSITAERTCAALRALLDG